MSSNLSFHVNPHFLKKNCDQFTTPMKKITDKSHCLLREKEDTVPLCLHKEDKTMVDEEEDFKPSANNYGNTKVQPVCLIV